MVTCWRILENFGLLLIPTTGHTNYICHSLAMHECMFTFCFVGPCLEDFVLIFATSTDLQISFKGIFSHDSRYLGR